MSLKQLFQQQRPRDKLGVKFYNRTKKNTNILLLARNPAPSSLAAPPPPKVGEKRGRSLCESVVSVHDPVT